MKHGVGIWKNAQQSYSGKFMNDNFEGYGVLAEGGNVYEGQWVKSQKDGDGSEEFSSGDFYIGKYKEGLFHGSGSYLWSNGSTYRG